MSVFCILALQLFIISTYSRIGLIAPNLFESMQLICPEHSSFPCPVPDAFIQSNQANHRFYEGYISCSNAKVTVTTSGLATINTILTTQLLIDIYRNDNDPIDFIVTYGITAGIDDRLNIGDVVVASKWSLYDLWSWQNVNDGPNDALPTEELGILTRKYGYWSSTEYHNVWFQPQPLYNETAEIHINTMYFYADINALNILRNIADDIEQLLDHCSTNIEDGSIDCLPTEPQIITNINGDECIGLTADIFVDNAAWRQMLFQQFGAQCLDMETAAVAMVAETNNIPFVAFRSLSDLAGADNNEDHKNVISIFMNVAVKNSITVLTQWIYYGYCNGTEDIGTEYTEYEDNKVHFAWFIVAIVFIVLWVVTSMIFMYFVYQSYQREKNDQYTTVS